MKKVYINPATIVVNIETAQMIAASRDDRPQIAIGEDVTTAAGADSRRGSIWDADED